MLHQAVEMIVSCVKVLLPESKKVHRAFTSLLDWAAWHHRVEPMLLAPTLRLGSWAALNTMWQPEVLQSAREDAFLQAYHMLVKDRQHPVMSTAEANARLDGVISMRPGVPLVLPNVGSGNLLFAARDRFGPGVRLMAAEHDLLQYRIAVLNNHVHSLGGWILRADALAHDLRSSSPNWMMSNWWTPPIQTELARLQSLANLIAK